ncbi:hypothetical protein BLNAU_1833 [Blattamonas nauphoetae]|uniref:TmcB/TmcC TPR repeats domain-containing protein n=1 Tax=Blattamonas nauphoetae TaxID=2049346 RepID=A0ABQ9YHT2_9EUKA|nr:hypothetical protein BLNAU_1833 [Blattamonas nauphoetae]
MSKPAGGDTPAGGGPTKEASTQMTEKISKRDDFIFTLIYPLAFQDKKGTPTFDFVLWIIHFIEYQSVGFFRNHLPLPEIFYKIVSFFSLSGIAYLSNISFWICVGATIFLFLLMIILLLIVSRAIKYLQKSMKWIVTYFRYFVKLYFSTLVIPSYCFLLNFFLWSYDKELDPIDYLYPNPSIKEFSATHIVAGAHVVYNYYCPETNPKCQALFGRKLGFWGILLAVDDLAQVVTSYTVSPFWIWRATGLSLWKAFFTYLYWSGKHLYRVEGNMLICINFLVGMVIDLASLVSMTLNDVLSAKIIIYVLTAFFVILCFPFVLTIFPKRFQSLWWLHLPGGEMYIDPNNPEHCVALKDKDPAIFTKPPKRPKLNWVVEVESDKVLYEQEKEEWNQDEEKMRNEMVEKKQKREEDMNKRRKTQSVIEMQEIDDETDNTMTDIDVIAPPHSVFKYPHIPKIYKEESVEPSIRFIYVPKWRNKRRREYVNQIYKQAIEKFPESPTLALTYATYLHYFMKDTKTAHSLIHTARQHHPQSLDMFTIFIATRDWQTDTKLGDEFSSAISQQQLNESLQVAEALHKEARQALREFWENLQRPLPDYGRVNPLLEKIDKYQKQAKKRYERLLVEYPNTPSVLRGYGSLMFEVFQDDETAEHFITRAEDLEEEEKENNPSNLDPDNRSVDDRSDVESRTRELARERQHQQINQIRQKKRRTQKSQASQLLNLELSEEAKTTSPLLYFLLIFLLLILLVGGALTAYFVCTGVCTSADTHLTTLDKVGSILTMSARLTTLSKLALSLTNNDFTILNPGIASMYFYDLPELTTAIKDVASNLYLVQHEIVINPTLSSFWEKTAQYFYILVTGGAVTILELRNDSIGGIIRTHAQNLNNAGQASTSLPLTDTTITACYAMMTNGPGIITERIKSILVSESTMITSAITSATITTVVVYVVVILVVILIILLYVWRTVKKATVNIKSSLLALSMVPRTTITSILSRLQDSSEMTAFAIEMAPGLTAEDDPFSVQAPLTQRSEHGNTPHSDNNLPSLFTDQIPSPRSRHTHNLDVDDPDGDLSDRSYRSGDWSDEDDSEKDMDHLSKTSTNPSKRGPADSPHVHPPQTVGPEQADTPHQSFSDASQPQFDIDQLNQMMMMNQMMIQQFSMQPNPDQTQLNHLMMQQAMLSQMIIQQSQNGSTQGMSPASETDNNHHLVFTPHKDDARPTTTPDKIDSSNPKTTRSTLSITTDDVAMTYALDVPPTPPSPSVAGAVHFDLSELNTKVRTEREFKEWTRNVKHAVSEIESKSMKFPSVVKVSVVIRVVLTLVVIIGFGTATILVSISSLNGSSVYGNEIILGQHRTMQLIHLQFLSLQLVFNTTSTTITNQTMPETTSPVFTDLTHIMNDQTALQHKINLALNYFERTDSHLRYGSSAYAQTSDTLLNSLQTNELEGQNSELDLLMFKQTDCLMPNSSYCVANPDRNYLTTPNFTGLDALHQVFISDCLHIAHYPITNQIVDKDIFLRMFTLANNDLYFGSLSFSEKLMDASKAFIIGAKLNILVMMIVSIVAYTITFIFLLFPLRGFFSQITNQSTLLRSLIPDIQHEDLQWKSEYESHYNPLDYSNKHTINLLSSLVELTEEHKDGSHLQSLRTISESILSSMQTQFNRESQWMKTNEYPHMDNHLKEHRYLMKEAAYLLRFILHQPESSFIITNALQIFFVSHIKRMDIPLGSWISKLEALGEDRANADVIDLQMEGEEAEEQPQLTQEELMTLLTVQQMYGLDPNLVLYAADMGIDLQSLIVLSQTNPEVIQQLTFAIQGANPGGPQYLTVPPG